MVEQAQKKSWSFYETNNARKQNQDFCYKSTKQAWYMTQEVFRGIIHITTFLLNATAWL